MTCSIEMRLTWVGRSKELFAIFCTYHIGTDIPTGNSKIMAYWVEIVARAAGAGVTTAMGSYPINVTLPVGTAMSISGEQQVTTLTASMFRFNVSGKQLAQCLSSPEHGTAAIQVATVEAKEYNNKKIIDHHYWRIPDYHIFPVSSNFFQTYRTRNKEQTHPLLHKKALPLPHSDNY